MAHKSAKRLTKVSHAPNEFHRPWNNLFISCFYRNSVTSQRTQWKVLQLFQMKTTCAFGLLSSMDQREHLTSVESSRFALISKKTIPSSAQRWSSWRRSTIPVYSKRETRLVRFARKPSSKHGYQHSMPDSSSRVSRHCWWTHRKPQTTHSNKKSLLFIRQTKINSTRLQLNGWRNSLKNEIH